MKFSSNLTILAAAFTVSTVLVSTACQEYEPPPEANLIRSGTGAYTVGEPLGIEFSAPVEADTLEIKIWPSARGTRRVPEADLEPILGPCSLQSPCDGLEIDIDSAGQTASLAFDGTIAGPGANFIVEVLPGLRDRDGNITGTSYLYNIRFRATAGDPNANIPFDSGTYILGGAVNQPMRAVLTLATHIQILPDGRFAMAAAKGVVQDDADETTRDPTLITIDDTDNGFILFATGLVVENAQGGRFLETDVFNVEIPVLGGTLFLELNDVRLFADIVKDEDGNDFIDGTLTYEEVVLINMSNGARNSYAGDSAELLGDFVAPANVPVGTPDMCEAICGAIIGVCEPPAEFPHPDFCE